MGQSTLITPAAAAPAPIADMVSRGVAFQASKALGLRKGWYGVSGLASWIAAGRGNVLGWNYHGARNRKMVLIGNSIPRTTGGYAIADNWQAQLAGRLIYDGTGRPIIWSGPRLVSDAGAQEANAAKSGSWTLRGYTSGAPSDVGIFASAMKSASTGNKVWMDVNSEDYIQVQNGGSAYSQNTLVGATSVAVIYNQAAANDNAVSMQITLAAFNSGTPPTTVGASDSNNSWQAVNMRGDSSTVRHKVSAFLQRPQQGWWLPNPANTVMLVGGVMDVIGFAEGFGTNDGVGDWIVDGTVGGSKLDYFNLSAQRTIFDNMFSADPTLVAVVSGANELSASWTAAQYRAELDSLTTYLASKGSYTVMHVIVPAPSGSANNYIDKVVAPTYDCANANGQFVLDLAAILGTYTYPGAPFANDLTHFSAALGALYATEMMALYNWVPGW